MRLSPIRQTAGQSRKHSLKHKALKSSTALFLSTTLLAGQAWAVGGATEPSDTSGTAPANFVGSWAEAVSGDGKTVFGVYETDDEDVYGFWKDGKFTKIEMPQGVVSDFEIFGASNDGKAFVGEYKLNEDTDAEERVGFVWQDGVYTKLSIDAGRLVSGVSVQEVSDVTPDGKVIVGSVSYPDEKFDNNIVAPAIWDENNNLTLLSTFESDSRYSAPDGRAYAVSDDGKLVVGVSQMLGSGFITRT